MNYDHIYFIQNILINYYRWKKSVITVSISIFVTHQQTPVESVPVAVSWHLNNCNIICFKCLNGKSFRNVLMLCCLFSCEPYWRKAKVNINAKEVTTPHTGGDHECTGEKPYDLKKAIMFWKIVISELSIVPLQKSIPPGKG